MQVDSALSLISKKDYENSKNQAASWSCLLCIIQDNLTNVPFTRCGNKELENINNSNTMAFTESPPDKKMVNVTDNAAMEELSSKTCCRYYSVEEYQKLPKINNLNIFHTNINGLESKLDNLHRFISGSHPKLDILVITETSERENVFK